MSLRDAVQLHERLHRVPPTHAAFAPGRVNLIGEHTDYNGGFVFPGAIDYGIWVTARVRDGETRMISAVAGPSKPFDAGSTVPSEAKGWAKYAAGMAWALREAGFGPMPNLECAVFSSLPMGSGVSSSAAIELAFGRLWQSIVGFEIDPIPLALLGQKCENAYVGVHCGVMDQMASACGKADHAVFIDTRALSVETVIVDPAWRVVLLNTGKPRALTDSAYNERRSECERAARDLGVPQLRDASIEALSSIKRTTPELAYRRAHHVITENARVQEFRNVLATRDLSGAFALMKASHDSLRDDYEVSCPELDAMAESAWVSAGIIGARMTGAGFGGACVALVHADQVEPFTARTLELYHRRTGRAGEALACTLSDGASGLSVTSL